MNIKIDTKAIDKTVSYMNLFTKTKKAIALYKAAADKLVEKELQLKQKLEDLQIEHTANLLDQQSTDDVGELVYLNKQARDIVNETAVIESMLERLNEAKTELKIKNAPLLRQALSNDQMAKSNKYDCTEIVKQLRYGNGCSVWGSST
ncbi:hypothetical protein ACWM35_13745 [Neobacillus sp. K501]